MLAVMQATFDTLAAARRLEGVGMNRQQAEAVAETAREAASCENLVTKADLKADLADLEARLTWRIFVVVGVVNGLLFAALKLVP